VFLLQGPWSEADVPWVSGPKGFQQGRPSPSPATMSGNQLLRQLHAERQARQATLSSREPEPEPEPQLPEPGQPLALLGGTGGGGTRSWSGSEVAVR
jgi:hypothetical protein